MNDGATSLNKDKQSQQCDCITFRKPSPHEADKLAELAEEACNEHFELDFTNGFSSSVQDIAASAASKELNAEKV